MRSILEMYNIGMGPDSALNIVPYRACREIYQSIADSKQVVHHIEVDFYNEYARLGIEAGCKKDVLAGFEFANFPIDIRYDEPTPPAARAPYTFDVMIYTSETEITARHRVVSISGGNYMITDKIKPPKYTFNSFDEMNNFFKNHKMSFLEFVSLFDPKEKIMDHFKTCIELMDTIIYRSLRKSGNLLLQDQGIHYTRRAKHMYENVSKNETDAEKTVRLISSYAYAIGEEVPEKCWMVACPTCASTSVVWSVLKWYRDKNPDVPEEKIINALCGAGLIASLVENNARLAASQVGCQGPIGTSCGIAAAALANLMFDATMDEMGRAFEMAYEHTLGLICDSVCPLPLIPCIQRCAAFAQRALDIAILNHSLMGQPELCKLDDVIKVLNDTGLDLITKNKRIAVGGFKEHAPYSVAPSALEKGGGC